MIFLRSPRLPQVAYSIDFPMLAEPHKETFEWDCIYL